MNLTQYSTSKKDAVYAVAGSLLLHVLLLVLFLGWVALALSAGEQSKAPEAPKERLVVLNPEFFQRPKAPEEVVPPPPAPPKKRYAQTNPASQEATPVQDTPLIGARSTRAASETLLSEGDPSLPSQITRKEARSERLNTFNSNFQKEKKVAKTATAQETPPQKTLAKAPSPSTRPAEIAKASQPALPDTSRADPAQSTTALKPRAASPSQSTPLPKTTPPLPKKAPIPLQPPPAPLAKSPTEIPLPEKVKEEQSKAKAVSPPPLKEPATPQETAQTSKEISPAPPNPPTPPQRVATPPKDKAKAASTRYQTESKKTRIVGSLSTKGPSSLAVQRTALGAYYRELSQIIEQRWQANCLRYRDHIKPGVISLRFLIDQNGKISAPRFHDVVSASEIQKGFTLKSVQRATLPPMPAAVQKELGGEDLELIYNFYF